MYRVIGRTGSRTGRVLWMLEELGQPYEHVPADPGTAEVRALNPTGKIPVLVVDGEAMTDSGAILQFLADRHGDFSFPAGSLERLRQDGFTGLVLDEFDALIWTAARHSFILPAEQRVAEIKPALKWEYERNQQALEARFGPGPFLTGERMTVPDILLAHCLLWARTAKFPDPPPRLAGFLAMMMARPAFGRAMAG